MKKLYCYCLACILFFACSKNAEKPSPVLANNPPVIAASSPKTQVTVLINKVPMNISILNYARGASTLSIEAEDNIQKVKLSVYNFYQPNPFSYMCTYEIFYATRADSLSPWNEYPPSNKNEDLYFYNFQPLKDSIVKGYFAKSFEINKLELDIHADFKLVFK